MNNAEFVAHARNETDEKPLTTELNFLRGALDRLEAAERRIEELETQAGEHTRWVLRNSVDKVELEALREESQQNRAEISSLKAALKAADDRAEMARQGNLYIETFPKPPYIATCKTEEQP
jgi:DNA repair exonuclease SbcCD ATPase subunit